MRTSPLLAMIALALSTSLQSVCAFQATDSPDAMNGASTWTIDNEQTSVVCAASHYGLSFIYGRFNKCSGSVEMDFQEPNSSKFRFEFDPDSIDTNNASRDVELRAPNCLNAAQFKTIVFESTSVKSEDESASIGRTKRTFQVTGNLAMRGVTRQITIPIELLAMGNGPNGNMRCGFMSRFVVNRSDFGIDKQKDTVGESIAVTFCFQAIHQQPKADEKKGVNPFELKSSQPRNPDSNDRKDSEQERLKELFRSDVIDSEDRSTEAFDEEESNDPGQLLEVD